MNIDSNLNKNIFTVKLNNEKIDKEKEDIIKNLRTKNSLKDGTGYIITAKDLPTKEE